LARIAEAGSAAIRTSMPAIQLTYTADELATAQAFRAAASYVPRIAALIDAAYRQHLTSARMYFEAVLRDVSASVECGVGFVDLSGFTALTQQLQPDELSMLLSEFSATVTDVVHATGGRVVKFIGDAVMWVAPRPAGLVQAAADMVHHPKAVQAGLQVRAGIAYGSMVALNGDYFGVPVNLAARLVAAAEPGQILAAQSVRDALPDQPARALEPIALKGFDRPQPVYQLDDRRPQG
jgi:class 3 adenylate cyclase